MSEGFNWYIFCNIRSINTCQVLWKRDECLCVVVPLLPPVPKSRLRTDWRWSTSGLSAALSPRGPGSQTQVPILSHLFIENMLSCNCHNVSTGNHILSKNFAVISREQIAIALLLLGFFVMKRSPLLPSFQWDMLTYSCNGWWLFMRSTLQCPNNTGQLPRVS